jgi:hypothetical protein
MDIRASDDKVDWAAMSAYGQRHFSPRAIARDSQERAARTSGRWKRRWLGRRWAMTMEAGCSADLERHAHCLEVRSADPVLEEARGDDGQALLLRGRSRHRRIESVATHSPSRKIDRGKYKWVELVTTLFIDG